MHKVASKLAMVD